MKNTHERDQNKGKAVTYASVMQWQIRWHARKQNNKTCKLRPTQSDKKRVW